MEMYVGRIVLAPRLSNYSKSEHLSVVTVIQPLSIVYLY
jgi:hypothetical protein